MTPNNAIVIGGGIAGCSTAYALALRGIRVTLLERNAAIASEASGNPLAMLYPRLSGNDAASQFALAGYLHSLSLFKGLNLDQTDFDTCGLLQLGFNARELARIKKVAAQNHPTNILKYVTPLEASALSGIEILHDALYFPGAAWVDPKQLCTRLTQHKNISVITLTKVYNILKNNELFELYSDKSLIEKAEIVIIANANGAQNLSLNNLSIGTYLKTQAVRGQVSRLNATDASRKLQTIVCSDGYLSPIAKNQHCLGATFTAEKNDLSLDIADHLANLEKLKTISEPLHQSLKANVAGGHVALRCTAPDYFPLVGELLDSAALKSAPPRPTAAMGPLLWIKGLYMNVAHGSKGFTSAPLCAELLASLICNEALPIPPTLAGLLNPNRFILREMGLKRLAKMMAISS
ncbi:MAG: FAD-dependent 5-carboxymethylaminomethyl-2-thiouridine(34) oxidoreductase MnmC [Methylotenera sp.]